MRTFNWRAWVALIGAPLLVLLHTLFGACVGARAGFGEVRDAWYEIKMPPR